MGRGILDGWVLNRDDPREGENKDFIEKYIKSQGREKDIRQLLLFDI